MSGTASKAIDIDFLRTWIGREDRAEDVVSPSLAQRFLATFDMAGAAPHDGDVALRLIHFCLAQPVAPTSALGEDGHPQRGGFLPPVPLPRRMWAGGDLTFHGDLHIGDRVERMSRITDVAVKEGRAGLLCFVSVVHVITVNGTVVLEERQDIVYRGSDDGSAGRGPEPAAAGRYTQLVEPSPPLLFRYSAIAFNGHRIHYDRDYAAGVEGYPGLVVQGPLQATLLFNFATKLNGSPPSRFMFRGRSPLFDNGVFFLHAEQDGAGMKLWTARDRGPVAMTAEAAWS